MTSWILLFSTFYADVKKNYNSRTFSRNIHFEVKYLENGLADYNDTYMQKMLEQEWSDFCIVLLWFFAHFFCN